MSDVIQILKNKIQFINYQLDIISFENEKLKKVVLDPILVSYITDEEIKLLKEICDLESIDKLKIDISMLKRNRINYNSVFMTNIVGLIVNIIKELINYINTNKIKQEKLNLIVVSIENNIPIISPEYRDILNEILKETSISDEDIINILNKITPINDNNFKKKK